MKNLRMLFLFVVMLLSLMWAHPALAEGTVIPGVNIGVSTSDNPESVATSLQIITILTVLSLAPSILVLMTCFTRIVVVLGFVRNALALQQMPPTQVLVGLALFMTLFVMYPTFNQINDQALQPYLNGQLTQTQALTKAEIPLKHFMANQTRPQDLQLFLDYRKQALPDSVEAIPLSTLVPSYVISELKTAFELGFMIFIPFLIIDMVVASVLMSMGMMMLPPVMISMPFKVLLFIMVDGWYLVVKSLLAGYQ
ncbi:flagellar type III secretion system pore protein FliP [Tumebacillus sp. ITR2]|uniref:Flagellar biosynthetic protein FliP n=1 Tax=Tumebacillus amylolyticus TaxID=2801339 RepID=A0ABS1JFZ7_9BACL|nr:flagellar type III secretion system pore protein FliP [Tumebacillus amylolyticus]MBL0388924.1 flagellar type III secretion system pore protein FliP [Tumebacillus amylolyticus]